MPLDSHSYLVAQGWSGKGTGLRHGAISRPLAIPQKKNLNGLGKDRDEAFPFWDHLFSAAANAIQVKIANSSDEEDDSDTEGATSNPVFKRTSTGILSNRRPALGTSATTSGSSTPTDNAPRLSLLATAKRDAARKGLYSKFFRGPVLGLNDVLEGKQDETAVTVATSSSTPTAEELKEQKRAEKLERKVAKALRKAARAKRREEKAAAVANKCVDPPSASGDKIKGKKRKRDVDTGEAKPSKKKTKRLSGHAEGNTVDNALKIHADTTNTRITATTRETTSPIKDGPLAKKKKKRRDISNEP